MTRLSIWVIEYPWAENEQRLVAVYTDDEKANAALDAAVPEDSALDVLLYQIEVEGAAAEDTEKPIYLLVQSETPDVHYVLSAFSSLEAAQGTLDLQKESWRGDALSILDRSLAG